MTIRRLRPNRLINLDVLRDCKAFESNSSKSSCLDTKSLKSLVPNRFYTHFCVHGVLEIMISTIDDNMLFIYEFTILLIQIKALITPNVCMLSYFKYTSIIFYNFML